MLQRLRLGLILWLSILVYGTVSAQSTILFPPQTINPTCNGSINGSIIFSFQGDSTDFFFSWSGGNLPTNGNPTTGNGIVRQTGLLAGTYSIFILDLNSGFDTTVQANLANSQPLTLNGGNDISNCLGQPISLSATSNAAIGSVYTWTYTNANGPQALNGKSVVIPANPSPLALTSSTNVTVQVTDPSGCNATDQVFVTVNTPPVGQSSPSSQSICSGPVSISLSSNQTGTTFIWTVSQSGTTGALAGSGSTINQTVRATGLVNGTATYNIRPISSGGCVGTVFQSVVTVRPKPVITSSPDSSEICSGSASAVSLNSNITGASFAWRAIPTNVTGASSGNGTTISQTLNSTGSNSRVVYRVAGTVNSCVSDTVRVVVVVKLRPVVSVSPADTVNACSGALSTQNYSSSISGTTFSWTASANSVGAINGTGAVNAQTYSNAGSTVQRVTYSVTGIANGCTSLVKRHRVRVLPLPVVTATAVRDTVCSGDSVRINLVSNLTGTSFVWTSSATGVSGNTSGSGTPIRNALTATTNGQGSATYSIIGTAQTCSGLPKTKTVFVNPRPTILVTPATRTICSGTAAQFSLSSLVSGASFSWTVQPNSLTGASAGSGNSINQILTKPTVGLDSAIYSIQSSLGSCSGQTTLAKAYVRRVAAPVASIQSPVICSGSNVAVTFTPAGTWNWIVGNSPIIGATSGSGSQLSATLRLTAANDDSVTYKVFGTQSGCLSDTLYLKVVVKAIPRISFTKPNDTICSGQNTQILISSQPSEQVSFSWTASASNVTGASSGTGNQINQTLSLISGNAGFVVYNVSAVRAGCTGNRLDTSDVANPDIPFSTSVVSNNLCTGDTAKIQISGPASGVTFSWTVSNSNVSGASAGSGTVIRQKLQLISSASSGFVDYIITPQSGPCTGIPQTVRINVQPFPAAPVISVQGGASPICPGQSLTLTSDQLFGNQWFINGIAVSAPAGINRSLVVSDSGSYSVVFTNSNGCSSTSAITRIDLIVIPTKPVITGLSAICPGNSARLRSDANAGNQWQLNGADITGATDTVLTAQFAGAYTVRLTNSTCSVVSDTFFVSVFPAPAQPTITGNNFLCAGDTGLLVATDASSWQWLLNNNPIANQTSQNLTITNGGNFQVTIKDANGCSATSNVYNVQGIPANPIPTVSGVNSFCAGDSIILTTENQNPAWKNQWFKDGVALLNDTLRTLIVKSIGVYTVTLLSPRGCKSTSLPFSVTQKESPATPVISGLGLICPGGTNTLSSSSAEGNIWFLDGTQITGANNTTYDATSAGTYTVQVINLVGCKAVSQTFVLSNTTSPDVTATLQNPTTCGQPNGSISLAVTDGSGQFQYTWSPVTGGIIQGTQNQTALSAGNYTVLVQDIQSGCSQIVTGMVLNDPASFTATTQVTNVTSCAGDNGRINLIMTGSNGPFTFSWTGPVTASTQNLTNIPAGTYAVRITENGTGCVFILDSIQLGNNQPPKPVLVSSGPLEFCAGDSIILSTTAVGPYQWARIGSGALTGETTNQLTVKTSGLYYVRVANPAFPNCFSRSDTLSVLVNPLPANPTLNGGNSQICQGVSTSVSTTSLLTKQWTLDGNDIPGATGQFLEVSSGGTYCLKVTDENGCTNSGNSCRTITVNPIPPVTTISGNTGFCPGGQTQLTATPFDSATYDYTWLRNNNFITVQDVQQINATIEGWYRIRVVNQVTNCRIFSDSVFITNFTSPPAPVISGSGTICTGGSTYLISSPGVSYQWSFNNSPISGANNDSLLVTTGGVYTVSITDGNGCNAASNGFVVSEIAPPTPSVISGENTFCAGSSVILTASANSNYAWLFNGSAIPNQVAQTITANQFGNYQVLVINGTGCSDTSAVFTTVQGSANFTLNTTIISTSCASGIPQNNGSITVSPTGGSGNFTYQWTPALPALAIQSNLAPGAYSVVVTDAGSGCKVSLQNLTIAPTPVISGTPVVVNDSRCDLDNGSITLNPSGAAGPFTYQWTGFSETSNTLSGLPAGTYEVKVTDQTSGCGQTFGNIAVLKPDTIQVASTLTQPSSCGSVGLISLQTSGGSGIYNFAWSGTGSGIVPNSAIQSNLSAGTYAVTVTDTVSKCTAILSNLILQEGGTIAFDVVKQNPLGCGSTDGTASVVTGVQNATYTWIQLPATALADTDSSVNGLTVGNYRVIIQAGTCIDSADFNLTSPGLVLTPTTTPISGCGLSDGAISVQVTNAATSSTFTSLKNGQPFGITKDLTGLSFGQYKLYVTSAECFDSVIVDLVQPSGIAISAIIDSATTCLAADGKITASVPAIPGIAFQWYQLPARIAVGTGTSTLDNVRPGIYRLIAGNGLCSDSSSFIVPAKTQPSLNELVISPTFCGGNNGSIAVRDSAHFVSSLSTTQWLKGGNPIGSGYSIQNLTSGNYSLIITTDVPNSDIDCINSYSFNLSEGTGLGLAVSVDSADCNDSNGIASVSGSAQLVNAIYTWTNPVIPSFTASGASQNNLASGNYKVKVTSGTCVDSVLLFVPKKTNCNACSVSIAFTPTSPTICGASDGQIVAVVTGITNPTYQWLKMPGRTPVGNSATLSGIAGGLYRLIASEGTCKDSSDANLANPIPFTLSFTTDSASCADNDGSVAVQLLNASGSAQYSVFRMPARVSVSVNQTALNLSAGNYRIVAADGFCLDSTDVVIDKPDNCNPLCSLSLSAVQDSASCSDNDGGIALSVTGATNPNFAWTKFGTPSFTSNNQNLTGLSAGVYKVVVRDGTCKDSLFVTVKKPANCGTCSLQVLASSSPVTCDGISNGTAFAFVTSGGVGPFNYQLNGNTPQTLPDFLASFTDQPAGPFEVIVQDMTTFCSDTVSGFIGTQLSLSASAFTQSPTCSGGDGSIRVVVSGGFGPYSITLGSQTLVTNDGDTTFTGLSAGTYSVNISNVQGCTTSILGIQLTQPQKASVVFGTMVPASCSGTSDGSIVVNSVSGGSSFQYFISGISQNYQPLTNGSTISNLKAGTYTMSIRGSASCDLDTFFTISGPAPVLVSVGNLTNANCGDSTGTAKVVTLSGGNGSPWITQLFFNGTQFSTGILAADSMLFNLPAGDFSLVVTDSNSCNDTASFTIGTNQIVPSVTMTADKSSICSGDTVTFTAQNPANIPNAVFTWLLNNTVLNASGSVLKLDTLKNNDAVSVRISGNAACLSPDSALSGAVAIQVLPQGIQALAGINPVKIQACIGQSATLKALNLNQLPDVGYRWRVNGVVLPTDTNETIVLFPGLPVNQVQLILFTRSTSSCISKIRDTSDVVLVTQLQGFAAVDSIRQISPAPGQVICPASPVLFSVKSNLKGKVPYQVQWFRNDTLVFAGADTFATFTGLPNAARVNAVVVFDTTLTCVVTNSGPGKDSTNVIQIQVLPAGDIRCLPCALNATVSPSNINCAGAASGAITVQASGGSGGYKYSLLPFGPSNQLFPFFFSLTPGTYSVLVRDTVTGCTKTISGINIIIQNSYSVAVSAVNPTPCVQNADGKLEFVSVTDASSDLTKYKFRIRSTDPYTTNRLYTGLPAGTYSMDVLDTISGCLTQVSRTLVAPAALNAQASIVSIPTCYGAANAQIYLDTVLNGSGFYQYSLSGDSGTYTNVSINNPIPYGFGAGLASFYIRDVQTGCIDTISKQISQPDSLKLGADVVIGSQCYAPTGQIRFNQFSGGTGPLNISMKLPGSSQFVPVTLPVDSVLLNMIGGDYIFRIIDQNNCSKDLSLNVPSNSPKANLITIIKPCINDTNGVIRLSGLSGGTAPYTFRLSNDQGQVLRVQSDSVFAQLRPGIYSIAIQDSSSPNCEAVYTREVAPPATVRFNLAGFVQSTCENYDGIVKFLPQGGQPGYRYSFDTLVGNFTPYRLLTEDTLRLTGLSTRAPGQLYTLRILDQGPGNGCLYDTTFNVPGNSPLRFKYNLKNVKCFGENSGSVLIDSLNGTGPVLVRVVDQQTGVVVKTDSITGTFFLNNQFVVGGLPAGEFNLVVTQYGACSASRVSAFALTQPTQISISAKAYTPSAEGFGLGGVLLDTVRGSVAPYLISFNENAFFNYKPDTLFEGLNPGVYTILVQDSIGCEVSKKVEVIKDTEFFVPTLFTPNGDGFNDLFEIRNLPAGSKLLVKNRWGEEVYKSEPYQNDWDAKDLEEGTYFWVLEVPGKETRNGWVSIHR